MNQILFTMVALPITILLILLLSGSFRLKPDANWLILSLT